MIIPRQKTFSRIRIKLFGEDSEKTKALVGGGLAIGGTRLAKNINRKLANKFSNDKITDPELAKENKKLYKNLKKVAKKQKTVITEGFDGSYYNHSKPIVSKDVIKEAKNAYKSASEIKKNGGGYGWYGTFEKYDAGDHRRLKDAKDKLNYYKKVNKSRDHVNVSNEAFAGNTSSIDLAHELGHSKHYHGRDGSKIGKISHKLNKSRKKLEHKLLKKANDSKLLTNKNITLDHKDVGKGIGATSGLLSGIHSGRKKAKGEKENIAEKTSWAVPALAYKTPELIQEAEASRQGLKIMKEAGASKKFLRKSAKRLAVAHGTYGSSLIYPLAVAYGGRQAGKIIGGATVKKNKDKKKKD